MREAGIAHFVRLEDAPSRMGPSVLKTNFGVWTSNV
jgi:hypothetical protein